MNLLCLFFKTGDEELAERYIRSKFKVKGKLFLFRNTQRPENSFFTFNVNGFDQKDAGSFTIVIHRKPTTNTFYTINALNAVRREISNGRPDLNNEDIDWTRYENTLLVLKNDEIQRIPFEFVGNR